MNEIEGILTEKESMLLRFFWMGKNPKTRTATEKYLFDKEITQRKVIDSVNVTIDTIQHNLRKIRADPKIRKIYKKILLSINGKSWSVDPFV